MIVPADRHALALISGVMALEVVCILACICLAALLLETDARWTVASHPVEAPADD